MLFSPFDKDWERKLEEAEIEDLKEYCKQQGFTKEQTKIFVENSMNPQKLMKILEREATYGDSV